MATVWLATLTWQVMPWIGLLERQAALSCIECGGEALGKLSKAIVETAQAVVGATDAGSTYQGFGALCSLLGQLSHCWALPWRWSSDKRTMMSNSNPPCLCLPRLQRSHRRQKPAQSWVLHAGSGKAPPVIECVARNRDDFEQQIDDEEVQGCYRHLEEWTCGCVQGGEAMQG
ncbi:unnamed protein product [Ostreobium quekettii]|uniref:Uncharacterized protein n=1 Tax=Ostreobium quekettii TaxID=121088 RepID=A0A8S1J4W1_9CHLO|nr:unnamed protein product [Ostreobium quekettii]|eukprot:evm.model.scf_1338.2 EVM.evm.TU.scf_1338.2   scf_1338:10766-11284(-)